MMTGELFGLVRSLTRVTVCWGESYCSLRHHTCPI